MKWKPASVLMMIRRGLTKAPRDLNGNMITALRPNWRPVWLRPATLTGRPPPRALFTPGPKFKRRGLKAIGRPAETGLRFRTRQQVAGRAPLAACPSCGPKRQLRARPPGLGGESLGAGPAPGAQRAATQGRNPWRRFIDTKAAPGLSRQGPGRPAAAYGRRRQFGPQCAANSDYHLGAIVLANLGPAGCGRALAHAKRRSATGAGTMAPVGKWRRQPVGSISAQRIDCLMSSGSRETGAAVHRLDLARRLAGARIGRHASGPAPVGRRWRQLGRPASPDQGREIGNSRLRLAGAPAAQ